MPLYEIMCITTMQATPAQLVNSLQRLAVVVQKGAGVFRRVENLGVRPLAYRMKAHMKYNTIGRYVRLFIQASPVLVHDIEARLRVDDHIVRTMTIKHAQVAPIVLPKRTRFDKIQEGTTSTTGILTHAPKAEYDAAQLLLRLGYISKEDILALGRWKPDPAWEAFRQDEQLKLARGGSDHAKALLQLSIPTRENDLKDMARLSAAEEEEMIAYEEYRKQRNLRQLQDEDKYTADEEKAMERRLQWYYQTGQEMRDYKLAKQVLGGKKPRDRAHVVELVKDHPLRYTRHGKPVPPPAWATEQQTKQQ